MGKAYVRWALASAMLMIGLDAGAITIYVVPAAQTVDPGDAVATEIWISDLAPGGAPSLSVFDIDLTFDPGVLAIDTTDNDLDDVIDSVTLDPTAQMDLYSLGLNPLSAALTSAGTLNLFDLSYDLPAELDSMQAGSFLLASVVFTATASGINPIGIDINSLGDALGNPLSAAVLGGSVTVSGSGGTVPSLPPLWLLLWGLAMLVLNRSRVPR